MSLAAGPGTGGIRVRMAPSPTGPIHIGNMHTAFFNWLLARKSGGAFILRFEDTDRERSDQDYEKLIYEEMRWLGLDWDEGPDIGGAYGPYRQSERLDLYRTYSDRLVSAGHVYRCYCRPEELDAERQEAQAAGRAYKYSRRCRDLGPPEAARREAAGQAPSLRFAVPEGRVVVIDDLIRGRIEYPTEAISDFIIVRPNGMPLYNFAVVVDDIAMKITHVIRGEGHISNTPVQCLMYDALKEPRPLFGHLGHILLPSRQKMAKRSGNAFVGTYRDDGFLPEAVLNFMALLGWTPPDGREFVSLAEIVAEFDLGRVTKAPSIFDLEKLTWMNANYIRRLGHDELARRCQPFLQAAGLVATRAGDPETTPPGIVPRDREEIERIVGLEQERIETLAAIVPATDFFFRYRPRSESEAVRLIRSEGVEITLSRALDAYRDHRGPVEPGDRDPGWNAAALEVTGRALAAQLGLSAKLVFQPIRAAVTGRLASPPLFDTMAAIGREICLERLAGALHVAREPGEGEASG